MIRVLQVMGGLGFGGAQEIVMNIYRNIDRSNVQFDFVAFADSGSDYVKEILDLGGVIYTCPKYMVYNHREFCGWWNNFFHVHKEYRIVHGHLMGSAAVYLYIAKKAGCITISHSHNIAETKITLYYLVSWIYQRPIRYIADYFFACSREAGEYLFGDKIINSNKFRIVENGIDTNRFSFSMDSRTKVRNEYGIKDEFVVGNIARLYYQKNYSFFIDVIYELIKMDSAVMGLIVGAGPELGMLRKKADKLGISNKLIFAGAHPNPEAYYCAMDAFLCPSHYEGLSIATVEAQSTGLNSFVSENVPNMADMKADLYKKLSLNAGAKKWAEEIYKCKGKCRVSRGDMVRKSGFDIKNTSFEMERFYKSL